MNRVVVAPSARDDLDRIWDYIAIESESPIAAEKLLDRIHETFAQIARNPGSGTTCEWLRPGLRRFPVWPYIIFYTPQRDAVEILRVLHGARNIEALFGGDDG
jgi:toxin ParE1/3/4